MIVNIEVEFSNLEVIASIQLLGVGASECELNERASFSWCRTLLWPYQVSVGICRYFSN